VRSRYHSHCKSRAATLIGKPSASEKLLNNDLDVIQVSSKQQSGNTDAVRYLSVGHELGCAGGMDENFPHADGDAR
jgi:hypothetical protein